MSNDNQACGCPEYGMSRRALLRNVAAVSGAGVLSSVSGGVFSQVALASTGAASNVLVVLSLRGGADGLSLVVPYGDPALENARPHLVLPESQLLAKDGFFGLHPNFSPLMPLWNTGKLAAVQAVGLPQPNRSHFSAMEQVEDADPGSPERTGWINRLIGLNASQLPTQGLKVGSSLVPTSLYGPEPTVAVARIDEMSLAGPGDAAGNAARHRSLHTMWDVGAGPLARGARAALTVVDIFRPMVGKATVPQNGAKYPDGDLGRALAGTARLIRADVGAEVVTVDYGSWDMHQALGNLSWGVMREAVDELAKSLAAFFQDLGTLGTRVTLVTISEFGRRVVQNGNNGTDHGYGNAMLAMGAGVRGGRYLTRGWPGLSTAKLVEGDLAVTCDYRSVLTEVLRSRFNADTSKVFPGFQPEQVGLMAA